MSVEFKKASMYPDVDTIRSATANASDKPWDDRSDLEIKVKCEQLKAEIKSLEEDCVTMREHQALQIENNNFRAEITALKSKLAKAVEYIEKTRCENEIVTSGTGVHSIHIVDCRKCKALKDIGEL